MGKVIELPCDIGDDLYEIIIDKMSKEIYLDRYIVQDISIMAIKYSDDWTDRNEIGTKIFLDREMAEEVFEDMKSSDGYKDFVFFKEYNDK